MLLGIRWNSLRAKIIAWSFVPTALILALVAWVTFRAYQQVTQDLVIVRNQELTRFSASELGARLGSYVSLLTEYTGQLGVLPRMAYADDSDLVVDSSVLRRARSRLETFDGGVLVLSNRGTVLAAEPDRPEVLGQNWGNRAYFRQMLRTPQSVFSDVVSDGSEGAEVIVLAVPVKGNQGQFLGVMTGMFRLDAGAANPFRRDISQLGISDSGRAYLVDGTGQVIYHNDAAYLGADFSASTLVQRAVAGDMGALRTRDAEGRDIVASYAPVPGTPWGLLAEESWAAVTAGIMGYRRFLTALIILGVAVPALVVAIGVRRITKPISDLIGAAQQMAAGDFGQTITANTGDEIEELAEQFNVMAAHLQHSYAGLERRVADRTRDLAALNALAATVSQSLDLRTVLDQALLKTMEVLEIEAGGIYLLDEEAGLLQIATQRGFSPAFIADIDSLRLGEGFSGRVAETGEPLIVRDASNDPRLTRPTVKAERLHSMAVVPLSSKGDVLGTLFTITRGFREFSAQDVEILTSVGRQIGVAIENARLYESTKERLAQLSALQETAQAVASTLELDSLLRLIVEQAAGLLGADGGILNLVDWEAGTDRTVACTGVSTPIGGEGSPLKGSLSGWVTLHNQPTISNDLATDPRVDHRSIENVATLMGTGGRNAAVAPMAIKDKVIGTLALIDKGGGKEPFDPADLRLLVAFANQAATAIENARLFEAESRRRQEANLLAELAKVASGTLELHEVLRVLSQYAVDAFQVDCCCVFLFDAVTGRLRLAVDIGLTGRANAVAPEVPAPQFCEQEFLPSDWMRQTVFEALQPLVIEDVPADPHLLPVGDAAPQAGAPQAGVALAGRLQSALVVPIEVGGSTVGVLQVATRPPTRRRFSADEGRLALAMASQAAVAIENARLFDAEQRRAEQFRVLSEVGRRATSILDVDQLLEEIVRLIQQAFHYDACEIGLIEGSDLVFRAGVTRDGTAPFQSFRLKVGEEGVTGWVAATGQPLLLGDVRRDSRFVAVLDPDVRSELAVPLKAKDRTIGVLNIQSHRPDSFDASDLAVMQVLADQAAIAIENARLFAAEQRRAEQFRVVSEMGHRITSILDADEVMAEVVHLIQEAFGYDHVGIALIEGDEAVYKVGAGSLGSDPAFRFNPARLKVGTQGVTGWVAALGEPLLVPDVRREPRYVHMAGSKTLSELAVPIKTKDRVIGVLDVQSYRLNAFDSSDVAVLQSLSDQAAIAIENARLYEQAQRLAVIEERGRLARELHDAVTQTLFSASLISETLPTVWEADQQEGRELLSELRQLSRGAMAEMRTLLMELRPTALAEASLPDLLWQLGEAVTGRSGVPVTVTAEGECACPEDVHVALYRIAQEALNNVVKHARASQVMVGLRCFAAADGSSRVELRVTDNGVGFQASDLGPGELGLGIMKERATAIGARLSIESEVGHGTTVVVHWPGER